MDPEIKKLIDEYVEQIESKEPELRAFKDKIDVVISGAEKEFSILNNDLEAKFQDNKISEQEYLALFRDKKAIIIKETKDKLDSLVASLPTD